MDGSDETAKKPDLLFVHSATPSGNGYRVVRARESRIELGEMSGVREGEPVRGELLKLTPRRESPRLFDVDVVLPREEAVAASHAGPPRVATEAYRQNWDAVFGPPPKQYLN